MQGINFEACRIVWDMPFLRRGYPSEFWGFAAPLHMQGEAPPHAAYEVCIRRHARLKSNYGAKSLVMSRSLKTAYGAPVLPDTLLRALAGKPPKYDLLKFSSTDSEPSQRLRWFFYRRTTSGFKKKKRGVLGSEVREP
jgi:hypothetical protein